MPALLTTSSRIPCSGRSPVHPRPCSESVTDPEGTFLVALGHSPKETIWRRLWPAELDGVQGKPFAGGDGFVAVEMGGLQISRR